MDADEEFFLPISTREKAEYCENWAINAAHIESQGCYDWMATQLKPLRPNRVLDIGCGTGQGLLALTGHFSPRIVCIEENSDCIRITEGALKQERIPTESLVRLGYHELRDGTHFLVVDAEPIVASSTVTLIHGDILCDDPQLMRFLASQETFDAITLWLSGTFKWRRTCRSIADLAITTPVEYSGRVRDRVYELATRLLRPGGWLQIVDRTEPASDHIRLEDFADEYKPNASLTDIEVFAIAQRDYSERSDRGIRMMMSVTDTGRTGDPSNVVMTSALLRKPSSLRHLR
jgi:SAM-dependent methyltransferase